VNEGSATVQADVLDRWVGLGDLIDAVTDGQITGGHVSFQFTPDAGWKDAPLDTSFTERTGVFNFLNGVTKYKWAGLIPSIADAVISLGKIDLADTNVAALINELLTAWTNGHGDWANIGLYTLSALADAFLAVRKARKQLDRSSYEVPS